MPATFEFEGKTYELQEFDDGFDWFERGMLASIRLPDGRFVMGHIYAGPGMNTVKVKPVPQPYIEAVAIEPVITPQPTSQPDPA